MAVKVMIADDHSMIREGLKQLLELEGDFEVIAEACDGVDCLEKLKTVVPDILLLDINMPNMNGLEVLQKMKDMKMKVKINKYIFSLFRPPFFGKTKRRLPGNSLPMSHNIFYSLPMRFLICDDVRLAHRRGESPHLRRRNKQAGSGGVTHGEERKVA